MTETEIQKDIITFLKTISCLTYRMNSGNVRHNVKMAAPGTPDLMIITPYGFMFWIEVKTETGRVSLIQRDMHNKLRSYGQRVLIARSVEDVEEYIK